MANATTMPRRRQEARSATLTGFYFTHERTILGLVAFIVFIAFWEGLSWGWWADALAPLIGSTAEALRIRPLFLPSPSGIATRAWEMYFVTGEMWPHLGLSTLEFVAAAVIAIIVGVPAGLVSGRFRTLSYAVEPLLAGLNALPQIALLPLIILWMGTGLEARVFIIALLMFVPIILASHAAVKTVDPNLLKLGRSFSASERQVFRSIILPASVPFILAGIRLAIGRGMIGIVVGELYGSATGLGAMMSRAGSTFRTTDVFVGVLTLVLAGLALAALLRRVESRFGRWRKSVGNE